MSPEEPLPKVEGTQAVEQALNALRTLAAPVLEAAPHSTFFHVVSLLERLTKEAPRVGGDGPASLEKIRFRHDYALSFSSSDIAKARVIARPRSPERALEPPEPIFELTTTFLGLIGTVSPLPLYIAEEIVQDGEEQSARRDFLDIFHHRVISLLYRCVSKYMPAREHLTTRPDMWMNRALFLTGLDPSIQTRRLSVHPSVRVRLAPLLAGRGRGARVLALALREVLGHDVLGDEGKVSIEQFAGGWIEVDEAQRMVLGVRNHALGSETIVGKRAFGRSGRFRIHIGPLHGTSYRRLLKDGDLLPVIQEVVALCVREPLAYDVELDLAADAAPTFALTRGGAVLGRDTRLRGPAKKAERMSIYDVGTSAGDDRRAR